MTEYRELLSIVVPVHNEEQGIEAFHRHLTGVLASVDMDLEIVYVDDGSTDGTLQKLRGLRDETGALGVIQLSRNFGKEIAMTAGLDHVQGDAVVVIDGDLQDPPELILEFLKEWKNGYDVVYGRRVSREGETFLKRGTAHAFYRMMQRMSETPIPKDTGDFRLLSRRAVESLQRLREHHRFMKGLFAWIGYPQKEVAYYRKPRGAGQTKFTYWKLWNFALEGITSFSSIPLPLPSYIGLSTALGSFLYALFVIVKKLVLGDPVQGYPSLMVVILFLGGVQLISLGIIGEYLSRMFNEVKRRPLYLVSDFQPPERKSASPGSRPTK